MSSPSNVLFVAPLYCCDNNTTIRGEATRQGNTFLRTKTAYLLPSIAGATDRATHQGQHVIDGEGD